MRLSGSRLGIGILSLMAGSGCCIPTEVTIPELPLPVRPTLYHWPAGAIDILGEDVAIGIKTNQIKLIGWGESMEAVILTTHKE